MLNKSISQRTMGQKGGIISKMVSLDGEYAKSDEDNFKGWGVEKLKSNLLEREVPVGNTNKQGLINLAVFARKLGLKVVKIEEKWTVNA